MEFVDLSCNECGKCFRRLRKENDRSIKNGLKSYCSLRCRGKYKTVTGTIRLNCTRCGLSFTRRASQVGKVKNSNHFCGKSCAASYNNANKTHGTRRSKLEKFIENKLRKKFPTLEITTNDIVATSFELDFYFPTIKLALEINGIFHREAIYGNEKLRKIQLNDSRKSSVCLTRGIQLVIYNDIIKNFTSESGESAWLQIESLINPYF